ncbi:hypothetical protein VNI00_012471 [Paramarasmius palmivorus]|uniref:Uncharacterized protein n=1 Tax=Paramarasmius palmivorus TaxID=297713 RepID=A0AAW0C8J1_9AGAR
MLQQRINDAEVGEIVEDDDPRILALRLRIEDGKKEYQKRIHRLSEFRETNVDEDPAIFGADGEHLTRYLTEAIDYIQENRSRWDKASQPPKLCSESDICDILSRVATLEARLRDAQIVVAKHIEAQVNADDSDDQIYWDKQVEEIRTRIQQFTQEQRIDRERLTSAGAKMLVSNIQKPRFSNFEDAICFVVHRALAERVGIQRYEESVFRSLEKRQEELTAKVSEGLKEPRLLIDAHIPEEEQTSIESGTDIWGD